MKELVFFHPIIIIIIIIMNIDNFDDKASILTTKIDDFFHRMLIHDVEIWTPNLWA